MNKQLLTKVREAAHQAVKAFDRQPDWDNTCLAILALEEYQDALRRGRTLRREEVADFARRWDDRVEAGRAEQ